MNDIVSLFTVRRPINAEKIVVADQVYIKEKESLCEYRWCIDTRMLFGHMTTLNTAVLS